MCAMLLLGSLAHLVLHQMALVTCQCAFPARRLAQTACLDLGAGHISCKFSTELALSEMSTCMSTAQARANCGSVHDSAHGSSHKILRRSLVTSSLRGPFMRRYLYQTSWGGLLGGCCAKILQGPPAAGPFVMLL